MCIGAEYLRRELDGVVCWSLEMVFFCWWRMLLFFVNMGFAPVSGSEALGGSIK